LVLQKTLSIVAVVVASDELPNASTSEPVLTISLTDTGEEITRGIAEFLRQLQNVRGEFDKDHLGCARD
jgi:hypothetical protein